MVTLKTPRDIAVLREAGRVVAEALAAVRERAEVGITLSELDRVAAKVIDKAGATPAFLGYHPSWAPVPFPGVICASINDAVVHGIPSRARLSDGDLVSIDCGAFVGGWCGDAAISFIVGRPRPSDVELVAATDAALARGITAAQPGCQLGDVGSAIGTRPSGRLRAAGRSRGTWCRSGYARGPLRVQRRPARPRLPGPTRAGHSDRTHAHRGRDRRLRDRP